MISGEGIKRCPVCVCEGNGSKGYFCGRAVEQGKFNQKTKVLVVGNSGEGVEDTVKRARAMMGIDYHVGLLKTDGLQNGQRERVLRKVAETGVSNQWDAVVFFSTNGGVNQELLTQITGRAVMVVDSNEGYEYVTQLVDGEKIGSFAYQARSNGEWNWSVIKEGIMQITEYNRQVGE